MDPTHRASNPAGRVASEPTLAFERVVFFSDAVFAIVITLLVLPLTAEVELPDDSEDLAGHVLEMWPQVLTFVVSFLVVGQFWIAHHRMFRLVDHYDHVLLWLNLTCLLTVSFMPFPTAVLGAHTSGTDSDFPVVFYAASMTVTSVALTGTWVYAVRRELVDSNHSPQVRIFTIRAVVTSAIFLVSVGAAFFGLPVAVVFWLAVLPVTRILLSRALSGRVSMDAVRRQRRRGRRCG